MLAPEQRVVLLDQLRPPQDHMLDAAVATTFTLGLEAALVPPLAFAAGQLRSGTDPMSVLAAIRQCTDRVDVFAQAGMVTVPRRSSDLFAFLEPMVHEVVAPRGGLFHPKLWLLRYRAPDGDTAFRLLVLSRNLTDEHAWDLSLRLDGRRGSTVLPSNAPLAGLVRSLPRTVVHALPQEREARVHSLADDASRMEWELPDQFWDVAFHAFGVRGQSGSPDLSGYRHLVVAPFLEGKGLQRFRDRATRMTVVSRPEALDRLDPADLDQIDESFIISAVAPEAEDAGTGDSAPASLLDGLHAKLFVAERNRRAHLFVGSVNATDAAFSRNVELLVELVGGASRCGVDLLLDPEGSLGALLEPYETAGGAPPEPEDEARFQLETALRRLASRAWTVSAAQEGTSWTLTVRPDGPLTLDGFDATMELLTRPGTVRRLHGAEPQELRFGDVCLVEVTPFLVLRLRDGTGLEASCVVRAALVGDPAGRLDAVLAAQIDTPEKFLRFLALLLGLLQGTLLLHSSADGEGSGASDRGRAVSTGVFETLVRALALAPQVLDDVARLVNQLRASEQGRAVLPPGFLELWTVVSASRHELEAPA